MTASNGSAPRALYRPDAQGIRLLRAGLLPPEPAEAAWREWLRAGGDIETSEQGFARLLPLVYRNVGGGDERLSSIYRRSWMRNQVALRFAADGLRILGDARIPALALKGSALVGSAYRDDGTRPMGDFDVAVPVTDLRRAIDALIAAGLEPSDDDRDALLRARHSQPFADERGFELDLHRDILWRPGVEEQLWESSVEAEVGGEPCRILSPADQILHVCVHGASWNGVQPLRWAADAYKVIEANGGDIDWDRLARLSTANKLSLPVLGCLDFLARELDVAVPAETISSLEKAPVSRPERRMHLALARPPSYTRSLAMVWWFWDRYRARCAVNATRPGIRGFVEYMRGFWGLPSARAVPRFAFDRLVRERGARND